MYYCFTRTWWTYNPAYPDGLEPAPGRKHTIANFIETEEEARSICRKYNTTHDPGKLSRKAEYDVMPQYLKAQRRRNGD